MDGDVFTNVHGTQLGHVLMESIGGGIRVTFGLTETEEIGEHAPQPWTTITIGAKSALKTWRGNRARDIGVTFTAGEEPLTFLRADPSPYQTDTGHLSILDDAVSIWFPGTFIGTITNLTGYLHINQKLIQTGIPTVIL